MGTYYFELCINIENYQQQLEVKDMKIKQLELELTISKEKSNDKSQKIKDLFDKLQEIVKVYKIN